MTSGAENAQDATDRERTPGRRWLLIALVALGVAALAFGIGRFTAFGPATSAANPVGSSAEAGFARDMQLHHAQAVEMAMDIYRTTDDTELRTLATDIIVTQASQRGEMFGWLVEWGLPQRGGPLMEWMAGTDAHAEHGMTMDADATDDELRAEMGMASDAELAELRAATGQEADCLFLALMIRHHEGAIPMADAVLELGSEPRVLSVAGSMKDGQTAEIQAMTSMQSRLGCSG